MCSINALQQSWLCMLLVDWAWWRIWLLLISDVRFIIAWKLKSILDITSSWKSNGLFGLDGPITSLNNSVSVQQ